VTVGIAGEVGQQGIPEVAVSPSFAGVGAGVCLIDEDEFGTADEKLLAMALAADEIEGDDGVGVPLEE